MYFEANTLTFKFERNMLTNIHNKFKNNHVFINGCRDVTNLKFVHIKIITE